MNFHTILTTIDQRTHTQSDQEHTIAVTYLEKSLISFILNMRLNKISEKDIRKLLQSEIELSIILSRKLFQGQ